MTRFPWSAMVSAVAVLVLGVAAPAPAAADSSASPCPDADLAVVLVHDLASTPDVWSDLRADLTGAGLCTVPVTWGEPAGTDVPIPLAGLRGVDAGARDLADALDELCRQRSRCTVDVVAHGAGSLVTQRYLQDHGTDRVRSLTTLGAMWHGTEIAGLATAEQISRDLGTYDAALTLEKPLVDPLCAGCREIIAGSDLLRDLHARGVPTPGIDYTDIVSRCDGLVVPPESGASATSAVVALPGTDSSPCVHHWALPHDRNARDAVLAALPGSGM